MEQKIDRQELHRILLGISILDMSERQAVEEELWSRFSDGGGIDRFEAEKFFRERYFGNNDKVSPEEVDALRRAFQDAGLDV